MDPIVVRGAVHMLFHGGGGIYASWPLGRVVACDDHLIATVWPRWAHSALRAIGGGTTSDYTRVVPWAGVSALVQWGSRSVIRCGPHGDVYFIHLSDESTRTLRKAMEERGVSCERVQRRVRPLVTRPVR